MHWSGYINGQEPSCAWQNYIFQLREALIAILSQNCCVTNSVFSLDHEKISQCFFFFFFFLTTSSVLKIWVKIQTSCFNVGLLLLSSFPVRFLNGVCFVQSQSQTVPGGGTNKAQHHLWRQPLLEAMLSWNITCLAYTEKRKIKKRNKLFVSSEKFSFWLSNSIDQTA